MEFKTIFRNASNTLSENYWKTLGFILVSSLTVSLVTFLFSLLIEISNSFFVFLISIIVIFVTTLAIQVGLIKQFVCTYNDERVNVSDVFEYAEKYLKSSLGVWFSLLLKTIIPSLISIIPYGYIISAIWIMIIGLKYFFVYNELVHDDSPSVQISFMNAENVMYGNKLKLFLLIVFSFAVIVLINVILKVLGLILTIFWLIPLLCYVFVAFYEDARMSLNIAQKQQVEEKGDVAWYLR